MYCKTVTHPLHLHAIPELDLGQYSEKVEQSFWGFQVQDKKERSFKTFGDNAS